MSAQIPKDSNVFMTNSTGDKKNPPHNKEDHERLILRDGAAAAVPPAQQPEASRSKPASANPQVQAALTPVADNSQQLDDVVRAPIFFQFAPKLSDEVRRDNEARGIVLEIFSNPEPGLEGIFQEIHNDILGVGPDPRPADDISWGNSELNRPNTPLPLDFEGERETFKNRSF